VEKVIISKIKPKLFSDRLEEALGNSLDTEIRDDYVKFFGTLCLQCKGTQERLKFPVSPAVVRIVQADKGFQQEGSKKT